MHDPTVHPNAQSADDLVDPAIALVEAWLARAKELESRDDRLTFERLAELVGDEAGVGFVMAFTDRVARPDDNHVAAEQLREIATGTPLPSFLSAIDKALLRAGARLGPKLPDLVVPLARRRMRSLVGHLVAPAEPDELGQHLGARRSVGYDLNVNLLGEAVLGEKEAEARLRELMNLVHVPDVDYVSVKLSAISSKINHWAYDASLRRVIERLELLLDHASSVSPPTFLNFDMEEYHDLHITVAAFKAVLDDPSRRDVDAGIVLQAYLPDAFEILQDLVGWANQRHQRGGGTVKIRLVKGANLAMEKVDAAIHGWEQAPLPTKLEADASYRRCVDWALLPDRLRGVRIGLASHNLFDVAWATLLAQSRGVAPQVQFEMLQGMAAGHAKAVNESALGRDHPAMLMYTPAVGDDDFDVAISYLFRRLEENASTDNFLRALFDLEPGSSSFQHEADFFRRGVDMRKTVDGRPARTQDRTQPCTPWSGAGPFRNEPDTDPSLLANQQWIAAVAEGQSMPCQTPLTVDTEAVESAVLRGRAAGARWAALPASERRAILHRVGDHLCERRGDLITAMMHEASKTFSEADGEVSEAVDFARWYADQSLVLEDVQGAAFEPFGLIAVIPPWNFPTAIPAGGALAALASGNAAILKPAPETPRCAELVAEACWAAGVPTDVLQFMRTPDNEVGRRLVETVDAVILTGSTETADLFRSWNPDMKLFAETSGKNALIVTSSADLDLAVQDLVASAFGHAGQKCSAASLAILVGDVATSERFRRQLSDAVESLSVGSSLDLETEVAPLVGEGNDRLTRAAEQLDEGERWLVKPQRLDGGVLTPGVRDGVRPGSWFHRTECFGPILGLMAADNLDEAIDIANTSQFGLTGGIHTLDPEEVGRWAERIEVGNGYVNRPITGAIVQRQPFGGWKRSSVGPGAKAGGPNYLMQLGTWASTYDTDDYQAIWESHFSKAHDETELFCEANVFRYRTRSRVGLRIGANADQTEVQRFRRAAEVAGVALEVSQAGANEDDNPWFDQMSSAGVENVRFVGAVADPQVATAAAAAGINLVTGPVTPAGRVELQCFVKEQALSVTLHRFGNMTSEPALRSAVSAAVPGRT